MGAASGRMIGSREREFPPPHRPMAKRTFTLSMGCLAPRIEEQLHEQSLRLDLSPTERQLLQQDVDEVSRLLVRGVLASSEADKARRRIVKTVKQHLKPLEAEVDG